MLDLSSAALSAADIEYLAESCAYQPFKLPGPIYTGAGLSWRKPTPLRMIAENDDHPDRDRFIRESANQAAMYDRFIDFVDEHVGIAGKSFMDVASNAGFFCYRASQRGASAAVGLDVGDFDQTFDLVNDALGTGARYIRGSYDMRRHEIVGTEGAFDIVFNTAFMCHSSDPTFLLEALANRAEKALLIFSKFIRSDEYLIRFGQRTGHNFKQRFPLCFDSTTEISDSLLAFAFRELGFAQVLEIPREPTWLPRGDAWRAFLAIR